MLKHILNHCGFWPLGSWIAGMPTRLVSCHTCCPAASKDRFFRIYQCKKDSKLPTSFRKSQSLIFVGFVIFIDFIRFPEFIATWWIIMRLTVMGFSGNFVWPDAKVATMGGLWRACGSKSCMDFARNHQLSNLSNHMSYALRIFVCRFFGCQRLKPRLEWKAGALDTVRELIWGQPSRWLDSGFGPGGTGREGRKRCLGALHLVWWLCDVVWHIQWRLERLWCCVDTASIFSYEMIFCFSLTS